MNENVTSLLQRVGSYYHEKGISPAEFTKFACPSRDKCVGCAKRRSKFVSGKEALVTVGYERRALPRVLILSAEPGGASNIPSQRKAPAFREWEENKYIPEKGRTWHWREVHQVAWYILRRFWPKLTVAETRHLIAHTNSAKCCVNNKGRAQAKRSLFDNCRRHIAPEMKLLSPDILITQGEHAEKVITEHFRVAHKRLLLGRSGPKVNKEDWYRAEIRIHGRRVLWLRIPHPRRRPVLSANELDKLYERCAAAVRRWKRNGGQHLTQRSRVLRAVLED